jgi:hypothetical protein
MLTVSAKSNSSNTAPLEAGTYPARCVQIIDLGNQMNDLAGKYQRQVMILWELPTERLEINGEDKPRVMSATYTASLNDKAKLRAILESWRGRGFTDEELESFDLHNILDKTCMLTIVNKTSKTSGKQYSAVGSVSKLMKGVAVAEAETTIFAFDLDVGDDVWEQMKTLPNWIQDRIKASEEYKAHEQNDFTNINPEDLPFGD